MSLEPGDLKQQKIIQPVEWNSDGSSAKLLLWQAIVCGR